MRVAGRVHGEARPPERCGCARLVRAHPRLSGLVDNVRPAGDAAADGRAERRVEAVTGGGVVVGAELGRRLVEEVEGGEVALLHLGEQLRVCVRDHALVGGEGHGRDAPARGERLVLTEQVVAVVVVDERVGSEPEGEDVVDGPVGERRAVRHAPGVGLGRGPRLLSRDDAGELLVLGERSLDDLGPVRCLRLRSARQAQTAVPVRPPRLWVGRQPAYSWPMLASKVLLPTGMIPVTGSWICLSWSTCPQACVLDVSGTAAPTSIGEALGSRKLPTISWLATDVGSPRT